MTALKGVAVFGAPGSGKTTAGKLLLNVWPEAYFAEAGDVVGYLATVPLGQLPATEKEFVEEVATKIPDKPSAPIVRKDGSKLYLDLKEKYSPAWNAKVIIGRHAHVAHDRFAVIVGVRAYPSAVHFKKSGYLVVYLKASDVQLNTRVSQRETFSVDDAQEEHAREEETFSTSAIEKIAHITIDTGTVSKEDLVAQIKACVDTYPQTSI